MSKKNGLEVIIAQVNERVEASFYKDLKNKSSLHTRIIKFKKIKELINIIKQSVYTEQLVFLDDAKANLNQFAKYFSTTNFVVLTHEHKFYQGDHILYINKESWQQYCLNIVKSDAELFSPVNLRNHVQYYNFLRNGSNHNEAVGRLLLSPVNELDFENIKSIIKQYKVDLNLIPLEGCTIPQRLFMHYKRSGDQFELSGQKLDNIEKRLEILKFFIENGADINLVNSYGQTILHIAAFIGNIEASTYFELVFLGADETLQDLESKTALALMQPSERDMIIEIQNHYYNKGQEKSKDHMSKLLNDQQNKFLETLIKSVEELITNSSEGQQQLDRFNKAHLKVPQAKEKIILPNFLTKMIDHFSLDDSSLADILQYFICQKLLGDCNATQDHL